MELTYGQLEAILVAHLRVHPDRVSTLQSRIKQLQRLQFPPGVNVGRGTRMVYNGTHLFMMVTAFELIGHGYPAQAACNFVTDHWSSWSGAYALAAIQQRSFDEGREPVFALLAINSLWEIQIGEYNKPVPSRVTTYDLKGLMPFIRSSDRDSGTITVVKISAVLKSVLEFASKRAGVERASQYNSLFHEWLPGEKASGFYFATMYPDRSNLAMRQQLHSFYGNDPESMTHEGAEEARSFSENDFDSGIPF